MTKSKIQNLKLSNGEEKIPEEFYVFLEYSSNMTDQVNQHNFSLSKRLCSSGFINLLTLKNFQEYLEGDIEYLPFIRSSVRIQSPSAFMLKTINNYNIEYNLETVRKQFFPTYPSRFSSLFAFGDYDSCLQVASKYPSCWNLDTVRKFKISEEAMKWKDFIRVGKFNMEIVSLLRGMNMVNFSAEDQAFICKKYWEGEGNVTINTVTDIKKNMRRDYDSGVIYEYLIEGILEEAK